MEGYDPKKGVSDFRGLELLGGSESTLSKKILKFTEILGNAISVVFSAVAIKSCKFLTLEGQIFFCWFSFLFLVLFLFLFYCTINFYEISSFINIESTRSSLRGAVLCI